MSHQQCQGIAPTATRNDSKVGGVVLLICGAILAPMLIGIPIMLVGIYELTK